jgi:hypothetical protein
VYAFTPKPLQRSYFDTLTVVNRYTIAIVNSRDVYGPRSEEAQCTVISPAHLRTIVDCSARFFHTDTTDTLKYAGVVSDTMRLYTQASNRSRPLAKIEYVDSLGVVFATRICPANTYLFNDTLVWKWDTTGFKRIIVRAYDSGQPPFNQGADTITVGVYALLTINTAATYTASASWIERPIANAFDGTFAWPYVSNNVNPCTVTVVFPNPVSIAAVHVLLGQPGYQSADKDEYLVEGADSTADLVSKNGSFTLIVPRGANVGGIWNFAPVSPPISRKIIRFIVTRTYPGESDGNVHIYELQLFTLK